MVIRLLDRGNTGELLLEGSLNEASVEDTEKIFNELSDRFNKIILNLALLDDVSPASLRAFKQLNIKMRQNGGSLVLRNINPVVMEVLQVTGYAGSLKLENGSDFEKDE